MVAFPRTQSFLQKNQRYLPALFFTVGFFFDLLTTGRIDQTFSLVQQAVYLVILVLLLVWEVNPPPVFLKGHGVLKKLWEWRLALSHFLFGSLLSLYTIFYFKSASFLSSFLFLGLIAGLLVINEMPRFHNRGVTVRFALLALCLTSYFIYLVPVVLKFIGILSFAIAIFISASFFILIIYYLTRVLSDSEFLIYKALIPGMGINLLFCGLYFFKVLPPVPLSLKFAGIYHDINKVDGQYQLSFERESWWRVWEKGAQTFLARPGDKIHCFIQVFSPTEFNDQLSIEWLRWDGIQWKSWDSIPIQIVGGRDEGFRGYAHKSNYEPGPWQLRIKTSDMRELGRLYFHVVTAKESSQRSLVIERR